MRCSKACAGASQPRAATGERVSRYRPCGRLYGNYGGDRLNFDLAVEVAATEGIRVETVRAADDVSSATADRAAERRGIAGIFFGCDGVPREHRHRCSHRRVLDRQPDRRNRLPRCGRLDAPDASVFLPAGSDGRTNVAGVKRDQAARSWSSPQRGQGKWLF
jgi:hypothetical protein